MRQLHHVGPPSSFVSRTMLIFLCVSYSVQDNICRFKECFEDDRIIYLVLEVRPAQDRLPGPTSHLLTADFFSFTSVCGRRKPARVYHGQSGRGRST